MSTGTVTDKISQLTEYWELLFPGAVLPTPKDWAMLLLEFDEALIRQGMLKMAARYKPSRKDHVQHLQNFVRGTIVRLKAESETAKAAAQVSTTAKPDENRWNR
jgi:hypothetical protein